MNTVYQYAQSQRIINSYLKDIELLRGESEHQHFLSRLSLCDKKDYREPGLFDAKLEELKKLLSMSSKEVFDFLIEEDKPKGFLKEIARDADDDIIDYLATCRITDDINILERNGVEIPKDIKDKIDKLLTSERVNNICDVSKKDKLREQEGTLCVNGVGYLLNLKNHLDSKDYVRVVNTFIDLYKYYLDKVNETKLSNRNFVYGLTHCVIAVSNFYTRNVNGRIEEIQPYYPIGELYDYTAWLICDCLSDYTKTGSTLNLSSLSSDMIAELLLTHKLLLDDYPSNKWYPYGWILGRCYQELCNRIDSKYGYIRDHKESDLKTDLKRN